MLVTPYNHALEVDRILLTKRLAECLLDMGGIEEDAAWTNHRVIYIPVGEDRRVNVNTRVPKVSDYSYPHWGSSPIERFYHKIAIYGRIHSGLHDHIIFSESVHLTRGHPTIESILKRLRDKVLTTQGCVSAYTDVSQSAL